MSRDKIDKILAVAINPGAYEEEAIAALRKAREIVKADPKLAHPEPTTPVAPRRPDHSIQYKVTKVTQFWLPILLSNLSEQAYGLGLKSKLSFDIEQSTTTFAVDIRCDGLETACDAFVKHLNWLLNHINSQPPQE